MTRTGYCSSVRGIVFTVLVLITTSLTYEEVYCWSSVYRPHTALTCSVLNLVMSEKVCIYIYLTEWVLENWWYENRTHAVTLAPMPLWTFILISTLSLHLSQFFILMSMGEGAQHPVMSVPTGLSLHRIRDERCCDMFEGYCVISVLIPSSWKLTMWDFCAGLIGLPLGFL